MNCFFYLSKFLFILIKDSNIKFFILLESTITIYQYLLILIGIQNIYVFPIKFIYYLTIILYLASISFTNRYHLYLNIILIIVT